MHRRTYNRGMSSSNEPNFRQKIVVIAIVLLFILLLFVRMWRHRRIEGFGTTESRNHPVAIPMTSTGVVMSTTPVAGSWSGSATAKKPGASSVTSHAPSDVEDHEKNKIPAVPMIPLEKPLTPATTAQTIPTMPPTPVIEIPAGQEGMHRELIPRNISIERCYYTEEVVNPGTQFYFDFNGSGFDSSFYRSITVDADALDVEVRDLRLVTANQIQGLMVVGDAATTQYIHPKIFIHGLPVFRAPQPFGVVRRGDVLDINLTSIDESGQWGKFRVITNLDNALYDRIKVEPTSAHLETSNIKPLLPFYVDGTIEIAPGLSSGSYGLRVLMGTHEIFRKQPLVDVVRPNVGKSGSIENVEAKELAHRPGDTVDFDIEGSGFLPTQTASLSAKIDNVDAPPAVFTYVSPGKYTMSLIAPTTITKGVYGITIKHKNAVVFHKKSGFAIVPPNWVSQVRLTQPLSPGKSGQIQVVGRDLSADFMSTLHLEVDESRLKLTPLRLQDNRTLVADLDVAADVAPGDYIIHVYAGDKELRLPRGNIIKITP